MSFVLSIPSIRLLSAFNRYYLCKHNLRSLILPNLHEIEQTCFTEPRQVNNSPILLMLKIKYSFSFVPLLDNS